MMRADVHRVTLAGLLLAALSLAAIAAGVGVRNQGGDALASWAFRTPVALCLPVYLLAVIWQQRGHPIRLPMVLGIALLLHLAMLLAPPMLSSDLYRYVWDGRVQWAGINPYLHLPADPDLAFLRDQAVYPSINRATTAPTIYPPAAELFFASVAHSVPSLKAAMLLLDFGSIALLITLLRRTGQSPAQVLIFAWNPLVVWEFGNNAHVDGLAAAVLLAALLLLLSQRPAWAGVALGAAILTKFLPAIAAPAFWAIGRWRAAIAAGLTIAALYAIYTLWDGAGLHVLGFLGGYSAEEELNSGQGFWALAVLDRLASLPSWAPTLYQALAATALAAIGLRIAFHDAPRSADQLCAAISLLIVALLIALSPHYPWYYVWAAAFATASPGQPAFRAAIWLSSASLLLYQQTLPLHVVLPSLVFVPALLLIWRDRHLPQTLPPTSLPPAISPAV